MSEHKARLIRGLAGGCAGLVLFFLIAFLLNSASILGGTPNYSHMSFASHSSIARFGSHALALVMELIGVFALGAAIGISTLPFADEGAILIRDSVLHFFVTGALVLFAGWVFCFFDIQYGWLFFTGIYTLLYLLIWAGRWIGWYMEIAQIRARLGLVPGTSLAKWRETLPYLPLLLVLCAALPCLLMGIDRLVFVDVPVLSGLLMPYLLFPVVGFCSGLSLGKRQGFCPLYPVTAWLLNLPVVLIFYNSSALFHCHTLFLSTLAGNLTGTVYRRYKRSKEVSQ